MANEIVQRLLARVRQIREERGLTQESFAERAGLSYKYYQALETGKKKARIQLITVEKLAKACEMKLSQLVDFDDARFSVGEDPPGKADAHPVRRRGKG